MEKRGVWGKRVKRKKKYTSFLGTDLQILLSGGQMEQDNHPPPALLSDTKWPSGLDPSRGPRDVQGMTNR